MTDNLYISIENQNINEGAESNDTQQSSFIKKVKICSKKNAKILTTIFLMCILGIYIGGSFSMYNYSSPNEEICDLRRGWTKEEKCTFTYVEGMFDPYFYAFGVDCESFPRHFIDAYYIPYYFIYVNETETFYKEEIYIKYYGDFINVHFTNPGDEIYNVFTNSSGNIYCYYEKFFLFVFIGGICVSIIFTLSIYLNVSNVSRVY